MALDIYWSALLLLLPTVAAMSGRHVLARPFKRWRGQTPDHAVEWDVLCGGEDDVDHEARRFRWTFLQVYLLVMGAEWLQGPYVYTLFHDEKGLDDQTVVVLYITSYVAAAVSALGTGFLADRFGRRAACFAFCAVHSASSLTALSDRLWLLLVGRVLAGTALTLLWTVFESWMVTEFDTRRLHRSSAVSLGSMFGSMTTLNCTAAILGGVVAHCIVVALGSRANPFFAGILLDVVAAVLMFVYWNENYGDVRAVPEGQDSRMGPGAAVNRAGDIRVWALSFITCCFEGTAFLVLYLWPTVLQGAHASENPGRQGEVPYGVVFGTFMAAMILGATLFNFLVREHPAAILVAASSLLVLVFVRSELSKFSCFLLFEACNGVYVPSVAFQRGLVVAESNRAGLYGLMKIPLFLFVVIALCTAAQGEHNHIVIFAVSCALLAAAAVTALVALHDAGGGHSLVPSGPSDAAPEKEPGAETEDSLGGAVVRAECDARPQTHRV